MDTDTDFRYTEYEYECRYGYGIGVVHEGANHGVGESNKMDTELLGVHRSALQFQCDGNGHIKL